MKENQPPQIVDLSRYRQAAAERAAKTAKAAKAGKARSEGVFGGRRGAPIILGLIILLLVALWLAPKLGNLI